MSVLDKYNTLLQNLFDAVPGLLDTLITLSLSFPELTTISSLVVGTTIDRKLVTETVVIVESAGNSEVNGTYKFKGYKNSCGFYYRYGR
jgi:hypothetical protein